MIISSILSHFIRLFLATFNFKFSKFVCKYAQKHRALFGIIKRLKKIGCLICIGCLILSDLKAQGQPPLSTLSESEAAYFKQLVEGNNRFAFDFYKQAKRQPGNVYFSSYGIAHGLGMLAIGAKGKTAHQFQHTLSYSPAILLLMRDLDESLQKTVDTKNIRKILIINTLWLDKSLSILPSFKQTLMRNFKISSQSIDFTHHLGLSVQAVNQWIAQQSNGLVRQMIAAQDIAMNTHMLLTMVANLESEWSYPFEPNLTKRLPFQLSIQRTILTEMMHNTSTYLLRKGEEVDIIAIPCIQEEEEPQLSMVIFLPKKNFPLAELEKKFTWENWQQWKGELQNQTVSLILPRFRIDRYLDLNTILKALDLASIFSSEADFSQMVSQKGIYLNQALHKTSICIDEKGINLGLRKAKPKMMSVLGTQLPYLFTIDHPFLFMIWDQKTDSILFMGRLTIP